jgi:hypothetical protein
MQNISDEYGTPTRGAPKAIVLYDELGGSLDEISEALNDGFYQNATDGSNISYFQMNKDGDKTYKLNKIMITSTNAVGYTISGQYYIDGEWKIGEPVWDPTMDAALNVDAGNSQKAYILLPYEDMWGVPFMLVLTATGSTTFKVQCLEG